MGSISGIIFPELFKLPIRSNHQSNEDESQVTVDSTVFYFPTLFYFVELWTTTWFGFIAILISVTFSGSAGIGLVPTPEQQHLWIVWSISGSHPSLFNVAFCHLKINIYLCYFQEFLYFFILG